MKIRLLYLTISLTLLLPWGCGNHDAPDQDNAPLILSGDHGRNEKIAPPSSHPFAYRFTDAPEQEGQIGNEGVEYYDPSYRSGIEEMNKRGPGKIAQRPGTFALPAGINNQTGSGVIEIKTIDLPGIYLLAEFDNDIFDNTDYYFTNGIKLGLFHPALVSSPLSRALLPDLKNSISYYGLVFVQNMYTPIEIEKSEVQYGDRPFAAYLYLGHQKINCIPGRRIRISSELDLGVIGSAAMGGFVQGTIHEHEPVGWRNQVQNDLLLNYSIDLDKGLISLSWFEAGVKAGAQAGTLYDNLSAGIFLVAGKTNGYYYSPFQNTSGGQAFKKRIRYYFSFDFSSRFIAYDATLQGGIFNKGSVYRISRSRIEPLVFTGSAGIGLGIGRFSLEANQVYISPEFKDGKSHLWFGIKTILSL